MSKAVFFIVKMLLNRM